MAGPIGRRVGGRVWRAQTRIERWLVSWFGGGVMGEKASGIPLADDRRARGMTLRRVIRTAVMMCRSRLVSVDMSVRSHARIPRNGGKGRAGRAARPVTRPSPVHIQRRARPHRAADVRVRCWRHDCCWRTIRNGGCGGSLWAGRG
jgi:hypothetical protein